MFKINNELVKTNTAITVSFTDKLFDKLNKTALNNHVSFNSLVIQCCKYALDNQENQPHD